MAPLIGARTRFLDHEFETLHADTKKAWCVRSRTLRNLHAVHMFKHRTCEMLSSAQQSPFPNRVQIQKIVSSPEISMWPQNLFPTVFRLKTIERRFTTVLDIYLFDGPEPPAQCSDERFETIHQA